MCHGPTRRERSERGRIGGRPKAFADLAKLRLARTLFASKQNSITSICTTLGVSRSTLYRYLAEQEQAASGASQGLGGAIMPTAPRAAPARSRRCRPLKGRLRAQLPTETPAAVAFQQYARFTGIDRNENRRHFYLLRWQPSPFWWWPADAHLGSAGQREQQPGDRVPRPGARDVRGGTAGPPAAAAPVRARDLAVTTRLPLPVPVPAAIVARSELGGDSSAPGARQAVRSR